MICTQLDQVDGAELNKRGRIVARSWSCWNAFDVHERNLVCYIQKGIGSGIHVTKMKFTQCHYGSQRKYMHESACTRLLSETGTVNLNENGEMQ